MKRFGFFLTIVFLLSGFYATRAQESVPELPPDYKERHAIYDYSEKELKHTDSIPDFSSKPNSLKISGTVFLSDGVTPARDVILFITQADEHGNYILRKENKKRYVYHRAWVKTKSDGSYTFYTFIPGKYQHSNDLKKIHLAIKEPNQSIRQAADLVFDNDPLLRKSCRKKLARKGMHSILVLEKKEKMFVTTKDIVLGNRYSEYARN